MYSEPKKLNQCILRASRNSLYRKEAMKNKKVKDKDKNKDVYADCFSPADIGNMLYKFSFDKVKKTRTYTHPARRQSSSNILAGEVQ